MKRQTLIAAEVAVLVLAATAALGADPMTLFTAKSGAGMKVKVEGTSTVHDWQVQSTVVGGSLKVGPNFPIEPGQSVSPGKVEAEATVRVPATSLKSVEKDGSPYSDKMNEVMYGKLKPDTNPFIVFRLTELALKEAAKSKDAPYVYDAKGDLAVAGATNKVAMTVNVLPLGEKKLRVSGNTSVKMTDFGIQPPVLVGILSTGDPVKISFDWPLEQKAAPASAAK
jgi:polyisoprenoid-binding protein YceI